VKALALRLLLIVQWCLLSVAIDRFGAQRSDAAAALASAACCVAVVWLANRGN
jgi:hypothetical protein